MSICASCGHDNREDARFCERCGAALAPMPRAREQRKTVTVLFCDVTGSTELGESLDPERLRTLLAAYFGRMKAIVERHGGTVEKFIGDAVMAVFGVPVAHEDDALRAVRAAAEMRDALPELGIQGRIGVTTGEVVTGTEERLATGDAVNVAARLEQAASPGEVLIGDPTLALLRGVVEVEPVAPLALKGKAKPVAAHRLLGVLETPDRKHEMGFVGRRDELAVLARAAARASAEGRCELVTIIGDAGVGKSRLVSEALASIPARVAHGRCLPYGEGITYWPIVGVVKQLDVMPADEAAAMAVRSLLGETELPSSAEEIAWAFRKTLEQAARDGPLVVVFDDIQWGEETFLDLIEHVALLSSGAPIVLVCLARPELSERRPSWPIAIRLAPLADPEVVELLPAGLALGLRERIRRAAGGNPLFVREMVAMAAEADDEVVVPPTLQALLAARLDQLATDERSVLERGAVEGEVFHRGAVQALAPDEAQVTPRLAALVRKELIRPDTPVLAGEDGFRFRHLLIRDAAYDALPKAARAELHQRFASWLADRGSELVELDEILGYHLEQAWRYRNEVGIPDGELAVAARRRLLSAGRRSLERDDVTAAVSLLTRAAALTPVTEIDLGLEVDLIDALFWIGRRDDALGKARALADRAAAGGDRVSELCARLKLSEFLTSFEPEGATNRLATLVEEALPLFEEVGDDVALYVAYTALENVELVRARMDRVLDATERAGLHRQAAGLRRMAGRTAAARFYGTTPVSDFIAWLDEQDEEAVLRPRYRRFRACALAMLGRFDEARAEVDKVRADVAERGASILLGTLLSQEAVLIELLAGDPRAAVEVGTKGCRLLEEVGEKGLLSTSVGNLAQALYAADRLDEAYEWAGRADEIGSSDDAVTQMLWRQARAKVLARRGAGEEAERLAHQAVAIGHGTEMLNNHADAYADLGEVLRRVGKPADSATAFGQALERYERKGNLVSAERARERLAELAADAPV